MTTEIYNEDLEIQELYTRVRHGVEVKNFITQNEIGVRLMRRVSQELMNARSALETAPPEKVPGLQFDAATARNVLAWLGEAIMEGNDAENILTSMET